jgi:DNA-directed RNA polymerase II subunit RPB2
MLYGDNTEISTWEDLLNKKCIELLDVEEEEGSLIALSLDRLEKGKE